MCGKTGSNMRFKTDFNGYAVKFSPFEDGRIAVATSQNFGIIGNGRQYVLQVTIQCSKPGMQKSSIPDPARASVPDCHRLHSRACSKLLLLTPKMVCTIVLGAR